MSGLLVNKVAVVTGAGRGIGRATAVLFAKEGAKVLAADIDEEPVKETVSKIKSNGGVAIRFKADVTKQEDCINMVKKAAEELGNGSIDVLANIAGITRDKMLHQMTLDEWEFILKINLTGTFNCIQAASKYMREVAKEEMKNGNPKQRSIINISSTSSKGNIGQANYAASKAGVEGLTKTTAKEFAKFNIKCNAIAPGYVDTRLTQARKEGEFFGIPEKQREASLQVYKETGLNREAGKPEDIANVALFFASDLSGLVTGQVLTVAGGMIGTY